MMMVGKLCLNLNFDRLYRHAIANFITLEALAQNKRGNVYAIL